MKNGKQLGFVDLIAIICFVMVAAGAVILATILEASRSQLKLQLAKMERTFAAMTAPNEEAYLEVVGANPSLQEELRKSGAPFSPLLPPRWRDQRWSEDRPIMGGEPLDPWHWAACARETQRVWKMIEHTLEDPTAWREKREKTDSLLACWEYHMAYREGPRLFFDDLESEKKFDSLVTRLYRLGATEEVGRWLWTWREHPDDKKELVRVQNEISRLLACAGEDPPPRLDTTNALSIRDFQAWATKFR